MEKKIIQIDALPPLRRKTRVAAYARVSTAKDAMLHSLSAQVSYYNRMITSHEGWEFVGIYADEGISGTKSDRDDFQRMVADCRAGKIDLIVTKAISRFARNTATLLETVRELRGLGIDVYFEEQELHTMSGDGEMVLTFLASFAQEEARNVSENMKWRIRKDFEKGLIWGGRDMHGYRLVGRKLVVVPEEAELVRRIFGLYVSGVGFHSIAKRLNEEGIKPKHAKRWNKQTIQSIVGNLDYTGDLLLQKTYREDYLTKRTVANRGEKDQFLIEGDHEAIVDKETFYLALELRRKRAEYFKLDSRQEATYPLSGFVKCGVCGRNFNHKTTRYTEKWTCMTFLNRGKAECASKSVPDSELTRLTLEVLGIGELTKEALGARLESIEVFPDNRLVFHLRDGRAEERSWEDRSRKDSWTPEMRKKAGEKTAKRHKEKEECQQ